MSEPTPPDRPARAQPGRTPLLAGRTIAITRPADRSGRLAARLESAGAVVLLRPLIEIAEPDSWAPVDAALDRIASFDWVLFTSVNGAAAFARRMRERGEDPGAGWTARVGAVGEATAARLREEGIRVGIVAASQDSEGLAAALPMASMRGRALLLARAAEGRDLLPKALLEAGAQVTEVACYRTLPRRDEAAVLVREILSGAVGGVLVASPSAVKCLAQAFLDAHAAPPAGVAFVCIGPVTAGAARDAGWGRIATCETPGDEAAFETIVSVLAR